MLTNNLVAPQWSRHFVTGNSVQSDAAIPTKTGSYIRNKQVKSNFLSFLKIDKSGTKEINLSLALDFLV